MSTIIGYQTSSDVIVGADSVFSCGDGEIYTMPNWPKVIRSPAGAVVGVVGNYRLLQALGDLPFEPPPQGEAAIRRYFVGELVPHLVDAVGLAGDATPASPFGPRTLMLFAWGTELWVVGADLTVRPSAPLVAIGCGRHWAYGALYAVAHTDMPPLRRPTSTGCASGPWTW